PRPLHRFFALRTNTAKQMCNKSNITRSVIPSIFLLTTLFICGCSKDPTPSMSANPVPTTYTFANFNDSNSLKILAMADQVVALINTANTIPNTAISARTLGDMITTTGNPSNDSPLKLNNSGLKFATYSSAASLTDMLNYYDSVGTYRQS